MHPRSSTWAGLTVTATSVARAVQLCFLLPHDPTTAPSCCNIRCITSIPVSTQQACSGNLLQEVQHPISLDPSSQKFGASFSCTSKMSQVQVQVPVLQTFPKKLNSEALNSLFWCKQYNSYKIHTSISNWSTKRPCYTQIM